MNRKLAEELNKPIKKSQIIKSAKELFFEQGFANTSMNMIQKHANISKGLIYYHFKNKDDLGVEVLKYVLDQEYVQFDDFLNSLPKDKDRSIIFQFLDDYLVDLFGTTLQDRMTIQIIMDLLLNLKSNSSKKRVRKLYLGYIKKIADFLNVLGIPNPSIYAKMIIAILDGLMYVNFALGETLQESDNLHVIQALKCMVKLEEVK